MDWRETFNGDLEGFRAALATGSARSGRPNPRDGLRLSTVLVEVIADQRPSPEHRRRWLDKARPLIDCRIDARISAMVKPEDASAYILVTELAAACAEALTLADGVAATLPAVRRRISAGVSVLGNRRFVMPEPV